MEKHNKKSTLAHLVSILAIAALFICLVIVIFIKAANKKKVDALSEELNLAGIGQSENNDDMLNRLNEVSSGLEDLESAMNESNTTLNTLVNSDNRTTEKETIRMSEKDKSDITGGMGNLNDKLTGMSDRFNLSMSEFGSVLEALRKDGSNNKDVLTEKMLNVITKVDSLRGDYSDISDRIKELSDKVSEAFQSVANGKKSIASALATVGTRLGMDAENMPMILDFKKLSNAVRHSQDIAGAYECEGESVALTGASADNLPKGKACWVEGDYVVGNGKDIMDAYDNGHNTGYGEGYDYGYQEGYSAGLSEIENASIEYTCHRHTDGCFTKPVYRTEERSYTSCGCTCDGSAGVSWTVHCEDGCEVHGVPKGSTCQYLVCNGCGHVDHRGHTCGEGAGRVVKDYVEVLDHYEVNCGMTEETITEAKITFPNH